MRLHSTAGGCRGCHRVVLSLLVWIGFLGAGLAGADGTPPTQPTPPATAPTSTAPAQPTQPPAPAAGEHPAPTPGAKPAADPQRPVILLTGYEPFGGAEINPSWEAIKDLDGKPWHEYTLVARRLPVIWGAPLPRLKQYLEELHPVAVFSFGQGRPNGFYMESLARNERAPYEDNDGKKPAAVKIADGPAEYHVAELTHKIQASLAQQGYPIVLSKDAGKYLCEECLYSLLHLQATVFKTTYVQFCHVPALDNEVGKGAQKLKITVPVLRKFVADTLETWRAQARPPVPE